MTRVSCRHPSPRRGGDAPLIGATIRLLRNRKGSRMEGKPLVRSELVDAREAAYICGVAKRTWLRLCDSGRAPWGVKLGGCRRWRRSELLAWIEGGCKPVRPSGRAGR
ncbi:MAG: helix-turn-helix transcriptional regulator [Candidatus Hydrogenedentota bacterium]